MSEPILIALDYDGTYTADAGLWDAFIANCEARGHRVVCITMRHPHEAISPPCEVIYTGRKAKLAHAASIGLVPKIWIDDMPELLFQGAG